MCVVMKYATPVINIFEKEVTGLSNGLATGLLDGKPLVVINEFKQVIRTLGTYGETTTISKDLYDMVKGLNGISAKPNINHYSIKLTKTW